MAKTLFNPSSPTLISQHYHFPQRATRQDLHSVGPTGLASGQAGAPCPVACEPLVLDCPMPRRYGGACMPWRRSRGDPLRLSSGRTRIIHSACRAVQIACAVRSEPAGNTSETRADLHQLFLERPEDRGGHLPCLGGARFRLLDRGPQRRPGRQFPGSHRQGAAFGAGHASGFHRPCQQFERNQERGRSCRSASCDGGPGPGRGRDSQ